jgi:hypothetical protein
MFISAPAWAVAPTDVTRTGGLHFVGNPNLTVNPDNSLMATGEVAGAGTQATATLTADVVVTRGCITPSGSNRPRGLERERTTVTASETFETRQGRGTFSVTTEPITVGDFTCPSANMTPVVVSVRYTNITLTVESQTGTTTATFPDQTV